jgi:tetratricopeptide (TPR) repeat protein
MKRGFGLFVLLAVACSPQDVLSRQGATLRSTDYVQVAVDAEKKKAAEKEAVEQKQRDEREVVQRHVAKADAHMDLFEYEAAAGELKEAYRLSNDPALLVRVAEAVRATGDCAEAQTLYKQYLDKKLPSTARPDAKTVQARIDEAKACETKSGSKVDEVRQLYREGVTHYDLAEYDKAVVSFKEAYRLSNDPAYLFNVAQSYRMAKSCDDAMKFYQSFLRVSPDAPNKDKIEARIAEMKACSK